MSIKTVLQCNDAPPDVIIYAPATSEKPIGVNSTSPAIEDVEPRNPSRHRQRHRHGEMMSKHANRSEWVLDALLGGKSKVYSFLYFLLQLSLFTAHFCIQVKCILFLGCCYDLEISEPLKQVKGKAYSHDRQIDSARIKSQMHVAKKSEHFNSNGNNIRLSNCQMSAQATHVKLSQYVSKLPGWCLHG